MRVPGIMHWPGKIPDGQVLGEPCAAMDIFPTMLNAAGGDVSQYEVDGMDILPYVAEGDELSERTIYWEMGKQTAVRRGKWKLVINGQLVESSPPEDELHLANLEEDMGEKHNLKDVNPDVTEDLQHAAEDWRINIEERWEREFLPKKQGTVAH